LSPEDRGVRCFILCAGLGTRLRPITDHLPKPLLPVLGRPLLDRIIERLAPHARGRIAVNLHWKGASIERWIAASPYAHRTVLFHEEPILGTGGALRNAARLLRGGEFLVHNGDILTDLDPVRLIDAHRASGALATLAVRDEPGINTVGVEGDGTFAGVGEDAGGVRRVTFTGVAVYSPRFLRFLPGGASPVTRAWERARLAGFRIATLDCSDAAWSDLGTPQSYARALFGLLRAEGERCFVHPRARLSVVRTEGFVVVEEGAEEGAGVRLENAVVLPGACVREDLACAVAGRGFTLPLDPRALQAALAPAVDVLHPLARMFFKGAGRVRGTLLAGGGSDRAFLRVAAGRRTAVLMQSPPGDAVFEAHLRLHRLFERWDLRVPRLHAQHLPTRSALFEDLGDLRLYDRLRGLRDPATVEALYRGVLDEAARLHCSGLRPPRILPRSVDLPPFDEPYWRWETAYFLERFVLGVRGLDRLRDAALGEDLARLARTAAGFQKRVLHRDLQSQNIMLKGGVQPVLIDFQGARWGPPGYDLASLLWDPYAPLDGALRGRLLDHYRARMGDDLPPDLDASLLPCRLQRHMQALGAFGYLSREKGKRWFERHVPEALRLLKEEAALARRDYPALHALVRAL
jgi:NDP-sugar pyrophosphorylase family protein/aminoglycoside/choline kinase family phosphotransferase